MSKIVVYGMCGGVLYVYRKRSTYATLGCFTAFSTSKQDKYSAVSKDEADTIIAWESDVDWNHCRHDWYYFGVEVGE